MSFNLQKRLIFFPDTEEQVRAPKYAPPSPDLHVNRSIHQTHDISAPCVALFHDAKQNTTLQNNGEKAERRSGPLLPLRLTGTEVI